MTKIALLGAGGKMGVRLAGNLQGSRFEIAPVERGQDRDREDLHVRARAFLRRAALLGMAGAAAPKPWACSASQMRASRP